MQYGEADNVTDMEGLAAENRAANAPPEPDAAAARREAANNAVAAMSRRVGGGGIVSGIVAGYARPGAEHLHGLRDVKALRTQSVEAVLRRPCNKAGGMLGLYQQRMPVIVIKGIEGGHPADAPPISLVRGFTSANAKSGFIIHVQKLEKMVTDGNRRRAERADAVDR